MYNHDAECCLVSYSGSSTTYLPGNVQVLRTASSTLEGNPAFNFIFLQSKAVHQTGEIMYTVLFFNAVSNQSLLKYIYNLSKVDLPCPVNNYTQRYFTFCCPDVSCGGNKVDLSKCGHQIRFHPCIFSLEIASKYLSLWQLASYSIMQL